MSIWQEFITQQGASISAQGITGFAPAWLHKGLSEGFFTSLDDLGLIAVSGDDAASFLHNQLSNDIEHLTSKEARLAAYCSPKGRMLASLLLWKTDDTIFLQLDKSIQTTAQKRLQMFVMRAKARLVDVSETQVVLGMGGSAASAALTTWFAELPATPYDKIDNQHGSLIRVADANASPRYQWITSPSIAQQAWPVLAQTLTASDTSAWRLSQIHAAIPQITEPTYEQFVPQMINFEVIGGVNFRKGCYPGQEIVARSQYLGKLKRRMSIATVGATGVAAGAEVFSAIDPSQPCGMIVNAEQNGADSSLVLVELKLADQDAGNIHLGSADGALLQLLPLPYEVIDVTQ